MALASPSCDFLDFYYLHYLPPGKPLHIYIDFNDLSSFWFQDYTVSGLYNYRRIEHLNQVPPGLLAVLTFIGSSSVWSSAVD